MYFCLHNRLGPGRLIVLVVDISIHIVDDIPDIFISFRFVAEAVPVLVGNVADGTLHRAASL